MSERSPAGEDVGHVVRLPPSATGPVTEVLADAFHAYPVMRFVLGTRDPRYDRHLRRLVGFFVAARALRDEPILGLPAHPPDPELAAAALVSFPGRRESPPELDELREAVWEELGPGVRTRYETCGRVWEPLLSVDVPHVHLNMIGVRPGWTGRGLGRRLLEHVHRMSLDRPTSDGVTLTTEDPANVSLYEYLGYRRLGHARIAPELETWAMFRPDDAESPRR